MMIEGSGSTSNKRGNLAALPSCRLSAAFGSDRIAYAAQDSVPMAVEGVPDFATEGSFKLRPRL